MSLQNRNDPWPELKNQLVEAGCPSIRELLQPRWAVLAQALMEQYAQVTVKTDEPVHLAAFVRDFEKREAKGGLCRG